LESLLTSTIFSFEHSSASPSLGGINSPAGRSDQIARKAGQSLSLKQMPLDEVAALCSVGGIQRGGRRLTEVETYGITGRIKVVAKYQLRGGPLWALAQAIQDEA
jgi:hypothetical protein